MSEFAGALSVVTLPSGSSCHLSVLLYCALFDPQKSDLPNAISKMLLLTASHLIQKPRNQERGADGPFYLLQRAAVPPTEEAREQAENGDALPASNGPLSRQHVHFGDSDEGRGRFLK